MESVDRQTDCEHQWNPPVNPIGLGHAFHDLMVSTTGALKCVLTAIDCPRVPIDLAYVCR
jgi:hypothetical protein